MSTSARAPEQFAAPRMVGVRSARETFSRPASFDDLLGTLVQAAVPAVQALLRPAPAAGAPAAGAGGAAAPAAGAAAAGTDPLAALLAAALRAVLAAATGGGVATASSLPAAPRRGSNRLLRGHSEPFVFGIDDALLAALIGPLIAGVAGPIAQALPQLVNSANAHRLESRREDYRMIQQLMAGMDRAALVDRITAAAAASPAPGAAAGGADLAPLLALLQSGSAPATPASAAPPPAAAPAPAPAGGSAPAASVGTVSTPASVRHPVTAARRAPARAMQASRAVLQAVTGPPVEWAGSPRTLLVRDRAVTLRFRLVPGPAQPGSPLPRAVLRLVVREPGGRDLLTRDERLRDVQPDQELRVVLDPADLAGAPADVDLEVFAQLRWPAGAGDGVVRQATCVQRVVLSSGRHVVGPGVPAGEPVELTDMAAYRPFWNRLWSSPTPTDERPLWGLDIALRYSVVLVAEQPANGLMEARLQPGPEGEGLRVTTAGRMKSGLEVSVSEVAKLCDLWPGTPAPDAATVAAFAAPSWRATQAGDAVVPVRFDGPRRSRGALWVVAVPSLRRFPVARTLEVDGHGQVVSTAVEQVDFPVIEAVRVLGLVAREGAEESTGDESPAAAGQYAFEGYQVVRSTKVGLEPGAQAGATAAPVPVRRRSLTGATR